MWLCLCIICLKTVKIIKKQQDLCGIITEMKQIVGQREISTIQSKSLLTKKQALHVN